jgi:hypothetical protein
MSSLDSDFAWRAIQVFGSTIAKVWRCRGLGAHGARACDATRAYFLALTRRLRRKGSEAANRLEFAGTDQDQTKGIVERPLILLGIGGDPWTELEKPWS